MWYFCNQRLFIFILKKITCTSNLTNKTKHAKVIHRPSSSGTMAIFTKWIYYCVSVMCKITFKWNNLIFCFPWPHSCHDSKQSMDSILFTRVFCTLPPKVMAPSLPKVIAHHSTALIAIKMFPSPPSLLSDPTWFPSSYFVKYLGLNLQLSTGPV